MRPRSKKTRPQISIHALREEGDIHVVEVDAVGLPISIHALREEGDPVVFAAIIGKSLFLSTPSVRRATNRGKITKAQNCISIHALREEGDDFDAFATLSTFYFYPRPP